MTFAPKPAEPLVPVGPDEVVAPTRVVVRENGKYVTRIFPTEARAWTHAAELSRASELIVVQPAGDRPPTQISPSSRKFTKIRGYDRAIRLELARVYHAANAPDEST